MEFPLLGEMETEGDFETYSELDLKKVGAWAYAQHPSTDIICFRYTMPGDIEPRQWLPGDPPPLWRIGKLKAHNALFEACIIKYVAVPKYGWADFEWDEMPDLFRCTLAGSAFRALPLKLELVAKVLKAPYQKDMAGNRAMRKIAAPDKKTGERITYEQEPDLYHKTYAYCGDDVRVEKWIGDWCGPLPKYELPVWQHDMQMQIRGLKIDVELCEAAVEIGKRYSKTLTAELRAITNDEVMAHTQLPSMKNWLERQGIYLPDATADTIDAWISRFEPDNPVRRVLEIRRYLARSSAGKYQTALDCLGDDGRVHGATQYYGATTGRNTGRLFQPLNMRRPKFFGEGQAQIEILCAAIKTRDIDYIEAVEGANIMEALGDAARGMVIAEEENELCAGDYSVIESVATAGLANETEKLDVFRRGEDPYCWFASKVVGRTVLPKHHPDVTAQDKKDRQNIGKPGELGYGFAGGVGAWRKFDDSNNFTDKQVEGFRDVWRENHPRTVDLWNALDSCAKNAVLDAGEIYRYTAPDNEACEIAFQKKGDFLLMQLPSGRRLHYFHPTVQMSVLPWLDRNGDPVYKPTVFYWTTSDGRWKQVRGWRGQWTENSVQATARDLLMYGVFRAERAGYKSILTVYDENLTENRIGFADPEEFTRLLTGIQDDAPWAADWPIKCEPWIGPRYHKG